MEFAQQVKTAVDIVNVIGGHVRLRKQGQRYIGLCPFHEEKTPSFSVHAGFQIYKCFGCGKTGDAFSFLMDFQGLSFFEALKTLAEQVGMEMPRQAGKTGSQTDAGKRETLHYIHEIAQKFFVNQLMSRKGHKARQYFESRGLSKQDIADFGIGYAASGNILLNHFLTQGLKQSEIIESGLIGESEDKKSLYDRFRERLTFPIHSEVDKLIAFGGRIMESDKQPKYLNSPETLIYRKNSVLYNLNRAKTSMRKNNFAVMVEGYMDVIGVWKADVQNVIATCGTALTQQQVRTMRRHVDTVTVNFDSDEAGQNAANRSIEILLREGLNVRVLELPGGQDPYEYCESHGSESYRQQLKHAPQYFIWMLDRSRRQYDMESSEGRVAAFENLLVAIHWLPDPIRRASTATELADHIGIPRSLVLQRLSVSTGIPDKTMIRANPVKVLSPSERLLVQLFVSSQEARDELLQEACRIAQENHFPCRQIFGAIQTVAKDSDSFEYALVEGRLEAEDRERLSYLVFDKDLKQLSLKEGRQALHAVQRQGWQSQYRNLQNTISAAERSGNREEVSRLLSERMKLGRKLGEVPDGN